MYYVYLEEYPCLSLSRVPIHRVESLDLWSKTPNHGFECVCGYRVLSMYIHDIRISYLWICVYYILCKHNMDNTYGVIPMYGMIS